MKRDDRVCQLLAAGCLLLRHGGRHDIYVNPRSGQKQPCRGTARSTKRSPNTFSNFWD